MHMHASTYTHTHTHTHTHMCIPRASMRTSASPSTVSIPCDCAHTNARLVNLLSVTNIPRAGEIRFCSKTSLNLAMSSRGTERCKLYKWCAHLYKDQRCHQQFLYNFSIGHMQTGHRRTDVQDKWTRHMMTMRRYVGDSVTDRKTQNQKCRILCCSFCIPHSAGKLSRI